MSASSSLSDLKLIGDSVSIGEVIREVVRIGPYEDPVHVLDLDDVVQKHRNWLRKMPRVTPFYAVKCNDDSRILQTLHALGTGFDCASKGELERVLSLGVRPESIIFAQPAKSLASLLYARSKQVQTMTFDGALELEKIHRHYPEARLVLRIRHDSAKVRVTLGKKFGCDPVKDAPELLRRARALRMSVVGISFHVGSDCSEAEVYHEAVKVASGLFEYARSIGYGLTLLDVGGGFPGDKPLDPYATAINAALHQYFPPETNVRIMAEPGRYYAASAVTLVTFVDSKRVETEATADGTEASVMHYYLNDGVFGSFFCTAHEGQVSVPIVTHKTASAQHRSMVWGPTCDPMDLILSDVRLPELEIGDSVVFENVGAYGQVLACRFNGFSLPKVVAYLREGTWKILQELIRSSPTSKTQIADPDGKLLVSHQSYTPSVETTLSI